MSENATTIAEFIEQRQIELELSDGQVAEQLGYDNPNVVKMIKSGQIRMPVTKVLALAEMLDSEPGELMRLVLLETDPDLLDAIERCMGPLQLTPAEVRIINAIRKVNTGRDITPITFNRDAIVTLIVS
jgi:hypothetical protein